MIGLVPLPYKIAAGAAVVLLIATVSYFKGKEHGLERYYDFKSTVEAQNEAIRVDNERKLQALTEVNRRLDKGWSDALGELTRLGRTVRVRNNCGAGEMPAIPSAPIQPDEASAQRELSPEQCEAVANNAVTDAAQVMWLQHFIKQQHEATK